MKKTIPTLAIALMFLVPSFSYAATFEETRHSMLLQLISLIQQEITMLQAQLAAQQANEPLGAVSSPTDPSVTEQITTITHQLGTTQSTMHDFQLFTGSIQDSSWFNVVTNQPVESITGPNVTSFEVVTNGDTTYRLTKDPAYTYKVNLENVVQGQAFDITVTDTDGAVITKSLTL